MKDEKKDKTLLNIGIANSQTETVQRFGAAVKEHSVAYKGIDYENGIKLSKGLKEISKYKLNPNDKARNIKQQAGFAAEIKTQALENEAKILKKETRTKITRTDDMIKQPDGKGRTIGGVNDQLYDIAEVDSNGIYVEGSGRQLKYVGSDAKSCANKLLSKKYDKFRAADAPLEVPSDFYDGVIQELTGKSKQLKIQIDNAKQKGNYELAEKHRVRLEKVEKTKNNLRKGKLTKDEAVMARKMPFISTMSEVNRLAHLSGVEGAKASAMICGGVSAIQNTVALINGEKTVEEVISDITLDTGKAAIAGYAVNFAATEIGGLLANSQIECLRGLSKDNIPSAIVISLYEAGRILVSYGEGQIDKTECLIQLGNVGAGTIGSIVGYKIGDALIPKIGGVVGSIIGHAICIAYYNFIVNVLKKIRFAHDERIRIEAECRKSIEAMKAYRLQIEMATNAYVQEYSAVFNMALLKMETAYSCGDAENFIKGANMITEQLGGKPKFRNLEEFELLVQNSECIEF